MGFLGFGNYAKEGPGVYKSAVQKRRFFVFFDIYFRKFWKILSVNLVFILFSLPVVTIGPSMAGMTYVMRNFAKEEHAFVFSDFWDTFKRDFKQALPAGLIWICVMALSIFAVYFYLTNLYQGLIFYVLLGIAIFVLLILLFASNYLFLMLVTLNLPLKNLFKNALIFAFLGIKKNFFTLFWTLVILVATFYFWPIGILLFVLITPATLTLISSFNSYPIMKKYCIDPYYEQNEDENPENEKEAIESVFSDEAIIEDK